MTDAQLKMVVALYAGLSDNTIVCANVLLDKLHPLKGDRARAAREFEVHVQGLVGRFAYGLRVV